MAKNGDKLMRMIEEISSSELYQQMSSALNNDALERRHKYANETVGEDVYHWSSDEEEVDTGDEEDEDDDDDELMRMLEEVHGQVVHGPSGSSPMPPTGAIDHDERQRRMMRIDPFQRMFMGGMEMEQVSMPVSSFPGTTKKSSQITATSPTPTIPNGAICFICLEGDDEDDTTTTTSGEPLVRNCSCRGDSAGFAHMSCMVKYAEQKCKQAAAKPSFPAPWGPCPDLMTFAEPWTICPNCKQSYQQQVAIDLSSSFVTFTEMMATASINVYWNNMAIMTALKSNSEAYLNAIKDNNDLLKIIVDKSNQTSGKEKCEMLLTRMLSMVDQMKKDLKMNHWLHMPKTSVENYFYVMLCGNYEAQGNNFLGLLHSLDNTVESDKIAIPYFEKARVLYSLLGAEKAKLMEMNVASLKAHVKRHDDMASQPQGGKSSPPSASVSMTSIIENAKSLHARNIEHHGPTSVYTIEAGLNIVKCLYQACRVVEATRLAVKMLADSRRVHGNGHQITMKAEHFLELCSEYRVGVPKTYGSLCFQALRYEENGDICIVQGPIEDPRRLCNEMTLRVPSDEILPLKGCPVICHGLVKASHLNGKVGDRGTRRGDRIEVHFEDKSQKSAALVKPENLRIAFVLLPSEDDVLSTKLATLELESNMTGSTLTNSKPTAVITPTSSTVRRIVKAKRPPGV